MINQADIRSENIENLIYVGLRMNIQLVDRFGEIQTEDAHD